MIYHLLILVLIFPLLPLNAKEIADSRKLVSACQLTDIFERWYGGSTAAHVLIKKTDNSINIKALRKQTDRLLKSWLNLTCRNAVQVKVQNAKSRRMRRAIAAHHKRVNRLRLAIVKTFKDDPGRIYEVILAKVPHVGDQYYDIKDHKDMYVIFNQDVPYNSNTEAQKDLKLISKKINAQALIMFGARQVTSYRSLNCKNLRELRLIDVSQGGLYKLPPEFYECKALESLNLSENSISEIGPGIARLTRLRSLILGANPIRQINPQISSLKSLQYLDVSKTQLTKQQIKQLKKWLPKSKIITDGIYHSAEEKAFNLVLAQPQYAIADNILLKKPRYLPRNKGTHIVAATAYLQKKKVNVVVRLDSKTGKSQIFFKRDGHWLDVTEKVSRLKLRFRLRSR